MKLEQYEVPETEIILLSDETIVTASGCPDDCLNEGEVFPA